MKKVVVGFTLVLASIALVACGSSSSSSSSETTSPETTSESGAAAGGEANKEAEGGSGGGASALKIETASEGLAFSSKTATATAGMVMVDFTNGQAIPHDVAIENSEGEVLGQTETTSEGSDSTEIELEPGTYKFFCTVPGHREAGMEGTLTVK